MAACCFILAFLFDEAVVLTPLLLFLLLMKTVDVAVVVSVAIIITRAIIMMMEMYIAEEISGRLMIITFNSRPQPRKYNCNEVIEKGERVDRAARECIHSVSLERPRPYGVTYHKTCSFLPHLRTEKTLAFAFCSLHYSNTIRQSSLWHRRCY